MTRLCQDGGHPAVRTPTTIFVLVPGEDRYHSERYRAKFCLRHGRQLLAAIYKTAIDSAAELEPPEFCFACGEPAHSYPFEVMYYEDDWYARFDALLCEACWATLPGALGEALGRAEKLPQGPKRSYRPS